MCIRDRRNIVKSWVYEDGAVNVSYYSDPSLYYVTGEAETQTAYYPVSYTHLDVYKRQAHKCFTN